MSNSPLFGPGVRRSPLVTLLYAIRTVVAELSGSDLEIPKVCHHVGVIHISSSLSKILEPGEQIQAKIAAARRNAKTLKDKRSARSSDFTGMSAEISGEHVQAKIAAARHDADTLKDKIKRKKDELAETSPQLQRSQRQLMGAGRGSRRSRSKKSLWSRLLSNCEILGR